ncbi:MAG: hypothetical protein E7369_00205 [Clostridiales bacterium]|nr:hypothetical protein [Clostridiales bacterium]
MELLQFILSFFLKEFGLSNLEPIIDGLKNNSLDLKSILSTLTPEMLSPILNGLFKKQDPSPNEGSKGVSPIISFADKQIVDTLNAYFAN